MKYLVLWLIIFLIVYLTYFLFIIIRKEKLKQFKDNSYVKFLVKVNKLNIKKIEMKKMANIVAVSNGIIMATTFVILEFIKNLYLKMVVAIILLIVLQTLVYYIVGVMLRRDKNV